MCISQNVVCLLKTAQRPYMELGHISMPYLAMPDTELHIYRNKGTEDEIITICDGYSAMGTTGIA